MRKFLVLLLLAGCAPALPRPDLSAPATPYLATPVSAGFTTAPVSLGWWRLFANPTLNALESQGLAASPSLAEAAQNLAAAAQTSAAANGAYLPQITLNPNITRQAYPTGPNASPPFTVDSLTGTITYDPGLFGARHASFANGQAEIAYQQAALDAARQTLTGNIAAAAIAAAGFEAQITTTNQIIANQQTLLTLLNGEFADGAIPQLNVLQQQAQILATQASLYPLQTQAALQRDRLAVLTGTPPAQFSRSLPALTAYALPATIPVTLPSLYLANRPDLRAARAQVAAQNAALGLAIAKLYPDLTLSASGGYAAPTIGALFQPSAALWTLAGNLLQPLYEGGTLDARKRAAQANLAAALAAYRAALLNALGEAADTLQAVQNDETALTHAEAAARTASQAYQLARQQFALGAIDYTTVLTAQITASQQALALVQTRTILLLDIVRLQSAMAS